MADDPTQEPGTRDPRFGPQQSYGRSHMEIASAEAARVQTASALFPNPDHGRAYALLGQVKYHLEEISLMPVMVAELSEDLAAATGKIQELTGRMPQYEPALAELGWWITQTVATYRDFPPQLDPDGDAVEQAVEIFRDVLSTGTADRADLLRNLTMMVDCALSVFEGAKPNAIDENSLFPRAELMRARTALEQATRVTGFMAKLDMKKGAGDIESSLEILRGHIETLPVLPDGFPILHEKLEEAVANYTRAYESRNSSGVLRFMNRARVGIFAGLHVCEALLR